jgi:hypothetical protein
MNREALSKQVLVSLLKRKRKIYFSLIIIADLNDDFL